MRQSSDLHRFMVRCKGFRLRKKGTKPVLFYTEEQLLPIDKDGLFPGQLKPHIVPVTDNYDNPEPMAPDPGCKT